MWFGFLPQSIDQVQVLGGVLPPRVGRRRQLAQLRTSQFVMAMINDEDRLGLEAITGWGGLAYERGHA